MASRRNGVPRGAAIRQPQSERLKRGRREEGTLESSSQPSRGLQRRDGPKATVRLRPTRPIEGCGTAWLIAGAARPMPFAPALTSQQRGLVQTRNLGKANTVMKTTSDIATESMTLRGNEVFSNPREGGLRSWQVTPGTGGGQSDFRRREIRYGGQLVKCEER